MYTCRQPCIHADTVVELEKLLYRYMGTGYGANCHASLIFDGRGDNTACYVLFTHVIIIRAEHLNKQLCLGNSYKHGHD